MSSFVVRVSENSAAVFTLEGSVVQIGRAPDCHLVLPNVSVSRNHARVAVSNDEVVIYDLRSANGTLVNGEKVQNAVLRTGDKVKIGKFEMTFLGSDPSDQIYNGRFIGYLPKYDPRFVGAAAEEATFQLDRAAMAKLRGEQKTVSEARIWRVGETRQSWVPGEDSLTFGKKGNVEVSAGLGSGVVATISWTGGHHQLDKNARFGRVEVNGQTITSQVLKHGDRIRIGDDLFRYEQPEDDTR